MTALTETEEIVSVFTANTYTLIQRKVGFPALYATNGLIIPVLGPKVKMMRPYMFVNFENEV
jgi:hypothetical protein